MDIPQALIIGVPVVMITIAGGKKIKNVLMGSISSGGYYKREDEEGGKVFFKSNTGGDKREV